MYDQLHPLSYCEDFDLFKLLCSNIYANMEDVDSKAICVKKGAYLYEPDDSADKIFFIKHGRVKICVQNDCGKEIIKNINEKGDLFGVFAILGQQKRNEFAIALEDTEVYFSNLEELKMLMDSHTFFKEYIMFLIGKRAITAEKRIESLVFRDSRSRVIEFLIELAETKGQRVGYELLVRRFNTHQEIANFTATSRQTVTTILNDLRNKNILTFDRKRLLIRDLGLLEKEVLVLV